jgi:hypothetical protein
VVEPQDFARRRFRNSIGEFLAVGKDPLHFHRNIKIFEEILRRNRIFLSSDSLDEDERKPNQENPENQYPAERWPG